MDSGEFASEQLVGVLRDAAHAVKSPTTGPTDEVRALVIARNALDARIADQLALIDQTKAHEAEGAASVATWAARELHQDPGTTRQMVKAARTMRDLPSFGDAAHRGVLNGDHISAITYSLKHVGHDQTCVLEPDLLAAAVQNPPRELFTLARYAKAVFHPEDLDEAWLRGMDKEDFRCVRVGDGYQPVGFFGIDLGALIHTWLTAKSAPVDVDDDRTAAERRSAALHDLFSGALGGTLPAECGVKPHVNVIVDAETLKNALNRTAAQTNQRELLDREPAILEGFGPIGPALLAYIAFGGNLTPILVEGFKENRKILDVGRTQRLATNAQRKAIHLRQKGRCANRGCHHPIGEIHHITDWAYGGTTNLSNLAGLCRKCHALITMGRLVMTGTYDTGYTFTTTRAGPLARTG